MAKRDTWLYGTASLINDASSEIIKSLLPLLVSNPILAGIAGGVVEGLAESLKIIFGFLSDKLKNRRNFILVGYITSGVSRFFLSIIRFEFLVPIILAIDRIGKSIRDSPRDASIAEKEKNIFLGFSIQRAMDNIGAVIGVLISLLMLPKIGKSGLLFLAGIIGLMSFIPILLTKESKIKRDKPNFRSYKKILILGLPGVVNISYIFLTMAYPTWNPVLLYALFNLSYAFLVLPFSFESLIDKKYLLVFGYLIHPLSIIMAWEGVNPLLVFPIFGIGYGLIKTTSKKIASEFHGKATAVGLLQSFFGTLTMLGNLIFGLLWSYMGTTTILLAGVVSLVLNFIPMKMILHE